MEQLIKSLPVLISAARESHEVIEAAAIAAWKHVAGDLLNKQTAATNLNKKTLVVAVADAVWKKQLEAMSPQMLFRLNSILGARVVTRIEFRVDTSLVVQGPARPQVEKELTANDVSLEVWSAANTIEDEQLRKKFLRAATVSLRRTEQES